MAVLVIGVRGLIGDPDREECQDRRDKVEPGMRGLGKNAQAAGGYSHNDLQAGDDDCGQNRVPRRCTFFRAHQFRRRNGRATRHAGIIAAESGTVQATWEPRLWNR